ncbi:MAG TPA: DegT/DnrJ/EryC1/StrS family aminotransferase [Verrucomicrobiae bacterium]|nr:DegT/DnrJ/EryC1/StrS family aminotransferase [Verrucomicrobiae bacterium]
MMLAYSEALRSVRGNPCPRQTVHPVNRLETRNWDLLAALVSPRHADPIAALRGVIQTLTGRQRVYFAPSARCAIAQVLSLLPQQEVVMPAYTCPVVKAAVEVAGKRIIYVDLAKNNINATSAEFAEAAQPGRILLATHLFGVPTDIEAICDLARERNCVTIEDAASCIGATRNGRPLGTFGDFGIFSFERSKRFPAFHGGVIVVNNEQVFDPARLDTERVVETTLAMPAREFVFSLFYNVASMPWLYGRVTLPRILREYVGRDVNVDAPAAPPANARAREGSTSAYNREFHPYQARLVLRMLDRMDSIRERIARSVSIYLDAFGGRSIMTFVPDGCDRAGLLRFPIVFKGRERAEILRLALGRGVYPEVNFDLPLPEKSEWSRFPNAVWTARNLMELPLYTALSPRSAERLAQKLVEIESGRSRSELNEAERILAV